MAIIDYNKISGYKKPAPKFTDAMHRQFKLTGAPTPIGKQAARNIFKTMDKEELMKIVKANLAGYSDIAKELLGEENMNNELTLVEETIAEMKMVGEFTPKQLDILRKQMAKINTVDPESPSYKGIVNILDSMDRKQLEQMVNADIKWLTMLAKNRLRNIMSKDGRVSEAMDPVKPKQLKKDYDDRADEGDGDIDNDGDEDDSDEYLHKRRQAISKAVKKVKESLEVSEDVVKLEEGVSDDDKANLEEAGRKAAKAMKHGDAANAKSWREYMVKIVNAQRTPEDKKAAREIFNNAYKG